jgi:PhnB protein
MIVGTLFFKGKCVEAIEVYKKAFGAKVTRVVKYRETDHKQGIADAEIFMHGLKFWLTDEPGGPRSQVLVFDNLDATVQAFNTIKDNGGQVTHEPNKTPFSVCECAITDKFGIHWGMMVKSFNETEKVDAEHLKIVKSQTKGGHNFMITTMLLDGQCAPAVELYKQAFNAEVKQYVPFPAERKKHGVEHAEIFIHGHRYWLSDDGEPEGLGMVAVFQDLKDCNKAWDIMKEGAEITHAPAATKWSACEAALKDRFEIRWGFIMWDERTFVKE